jgi:hypothetical protein
MTWYFRILWTLQWKVRGHLPSFCPCSSSITNFMSAYAILCLIHAY